LTRIEIEEGASLALDFHKLDNVGGCVPVAIQLADSRELVLIAYTNEAAMREAFRTRRLVLYSTSRNEFWEKGATSGHRYELVSAFVNCEQNSLLYQVLPLADNLPGGICHTSGAAGAARATCFYREIDMATLALKNSEPRA
jgi:Phosphoribosyl-AMP cyclohydrolase